MGNNLKINTPLTDDVINNLKCRDIVYINGIIYTARDAAHKRLIEEYKKKSILPINIKNQIIFYAGPTPNRDDEVIGSIGPTTSYRMDDYTDELLSLGLKGMIGKGNRRKEVVDSIKKYRAIYFIAYGGVSAYLAKRVVNSKMICYDDLGTEAIRELLVKDFPVIVAIDAKGNSIYD